MAEHLTADPEIRRNWRLLFAATVGASVGMPNLALYSIGVFAPILAKTFDWSFASIMGGLGLTSVVLLLLGPIAGRFVDKHGARKIAAVSLVGASLSFMSFALSTGSILQYYVSWGCFALSGIGATAVSFSHAISEKFTAKRGFALGITLGGAGLFALLVKPFAGWAIDLVGWRWTIVAIGCFPLLVAAPLVLWGLPKRGEPAPTAGTSPTAAKPQGMTIKEALRSRAFWLIIASFGPIAFANGAPMPNMENILRTLQLTGREVIQVASLIGISIIVGRVFGGWLVDRIWAPAVGSALLLCAAAGCYILAGDHVTIYQAAAAVVLLSLAAGMEFDLLAFLIARYIGIRSFGAVYSILYGIFAVGAGGGPALLGHAYDSNGNYSFGLLICGAALLFAIIPILFLGRYPKFDKTVTA